MKRCFSSVSKPNSSPLPTENVQSLPVEEISPLVTRDIVGHKEGHGLNSDDLELESDPGLRKKITSYPRNLQDSYRRAYWLKGPCQPKITTFPCSTIGNDGRWFNWVLYTKYIKWLEYNISKDAAYFLCCYLFKPDIGDQAGGDTFVGKGFTNWKKKEKLDEHIKSANSSHYQY